MAETDRRPHFGAGDLTERVMLLRRPVGTEPGQERGDFEVAFQRWAAWRFMGARSLAEGGRDIDAADGRLVLRADPDTKTITIADRLRWNGFDWSIVSVTPSTRDWPFIECFINRNRNGS